MLMSSVAGTGINGMGAGAGAEEDVDEEGGWVGLAEAAGAAGNPWYCAHKFAYSSGVRTRCDSMVMGVYMRSFGSDDLMGPYGIHRGICEYLTMCFANFSQLC